MLSMQKIQLRFNHFLVEVSVEKQVFEYIKYAYINSPVSPKYC